MRFGVLVLWIYRVAPHGWVCPLCACLTSIGHEALDGSWRWDFLQLVPIVRCRDCSSQVIGIDPARTAVKIGF